MDDDKKKTPKEAVQEVIAALDLMHKPPNKGDPKKGGRAGLLKDRPGLAGDLKEIEKVAKVVVDKDGNIDPIEVKNLHATLEKAIDRAHKLETGEFKKGKKTTPGEKAAAKDIHERLEKIQKDLNTVPGLEGPKMKKAKEEALQQAAIPAAKEDIGEAVAPPRTPAISKKSGLDR